MDADGCSRDGSPDIGAYEWMTRAERQTALEYISIRYSIANRRTFPCVSILEGR